MTEAILTVWEKNFSFCFAEVSLGSHLSEAQNGISSSVPLLLVAVGVGGVALEGLE